MLFFECPSCAARSVNGHALAQLDGGITVPQIVRVEVRDPRSRACPCHHLLGHARAEAGDYPPLGRAIVKRAGLLHFDHQPRRDPDPAPSVRRLAVTDAKAASGDVDVPPLESVELALREKHFSTGKQSENEVLIG